MGSEFSRVLEREESDLSDLQAIDGNGFPGSDYRPGSRKNWMEELGADNIRINQIVWPGTHNSATDEIGNLVTRPFAQCQSVSIYDQLVMGTRALDIRVQRDRLICHGGELGYNMDVVIGDIRRFLSETQHEVLILEVRTEYGQENPQDFDAYLVDRLGDYLIHHDENVFSRTISQLLPRRVICVWKPRDRAGPGPGQPLWGGEYLRDRWIDTDLPLTKFTRNMEHLSEQAPASRRNYFYRVENTLTGQAQHLNVIVSEVSGRMHRHARLFISQCFSGGHADKLQIFSTDFVYEDFVDACAGVTYARITGRA